MLLQRPGYQHFMGFEPSPLSDSGCKRCNRCMRYPLFRYLVGGKCRGVSLSFFIQLHKMSPEHLFLGAFSQIDTASLWVLAEGKNPSLTRIRIKTQQFAVGSCDTPAHTHSSANSLSVTLFVLTMSCALPARLARVPPRCIEHSRLCLSCGKQL